MPRKIYFLIPPIVHGEELLNQYFSLGFSHYEICSFLALAHGTYYR